MISRRLLRPAPSAVRARLADHVRSPLTRSGYALLLNSVITSILGLGYWILAAHIFGADELGHGAALVAALLLVTGLATAGLKRGLIRFVPTGGGSARRLVRNIYGVGLAATLALGAVLLLAFPGWAGRLGLVHHGWVPPVLFLAGAGVWGVFVLQDAVLIGARRATAVPITNAAFSALKIALLVLFASTLPRRWGVFGSWVVPAAVIAVAVNVWLYRRGLARRGEPAAGAPPTVGQVVRFTGAEYTAALLWMTALYVTPLMVLARSGAVANAHYYLAAQIAYVLFLLSSNITDALVAEGARAAAGLAGKVRRTGVQISILLVPAVAMVLVAAPRIMEVFGSGYGGDASTALRLLALAAVPNAVSTMVIAVAHVRRRMWLVVVLQALMAVTTLGLGFALIRGHGIVGVGWAWLISQTLTAVVAVVLTLEVETALTREFRRRLVAVASAARARTTRARAHQLVRSRISAVPRGAFPDGPGRLLGWQHDVIVVAAGSAGAPLVVRLAVGRSGRDVIAAHRRQLESLHGDPRLAGLIHAVPEVLQTDDQHRWLVETSVPGTPRSELPDPPARAAAMTAGLAMLDRLHAATARQIQAGDDLVDMWVHEPVAVVADVVRTDRAARGLASLHRRLTSELQERPLSISLLHGDPSFDNFLCSADGCQVTGIVDWESSQLGPPELDLIALVLARRQARGNEMGDEMVDLLGNGWSEDERELLGPAWSVNAHVRPTTLLLLTWLRHVAANLEKSERYASNPWWIRNNVERVLSALDTDGIGASALEPDPLAPDVRMRVPRVLPSAAQRAPRTPRLTPARLRSAVAVTSLASWLAYALSAPLAVRIALVLAAVLVAPAVAFGRCIDEPLTLVRGVLGATGAVALDVIVAEILLYSGAWSPGLLLVLVGLTAFALCLFVPAPAPLPTAWRRARRRAHRPERTGTALRPRVEVRP